METQKDPRIKIQASTNEDLFDLNLCAKEFIDLIDNFKNKFLTHVVALHNKMEKLLQPIALLCLQCFFKLY